MHDKRISLAATCLLCGTLLACGQDIDGNASAPPAKVIPKAGKAEKQYASVCAACHGNAAQGEAFFPQLAGRPAAELAERLYAYRAGKKIGPHSETMRPIAGALTEDQIIGIAQWLSTLPKPNH